MELEGSHDDIAVQIVTAALADEFARLERSHIEATVQRHLDELHARARVSTFIAERHAREELQRLERSTTEPPMILHGAASNRAASGSLSSPEWG